MVPRAEQSPGFALVIDRRSGSWTDIQVDYHYHGDHRDDDDDDDDDDDNDDDDIDDDDIDDDDIDDDDIDADDIDDVNEDAKGGTVLPLCC